MKERGSRVNPTLQDPRHRHDPPVPEHRDLQARLVAVARYHWPVLLLVALALAVRLWGLFPTFVYGDDAEYAAVARSLSHGWRNLAYPDLEGFGPTPFVSQPPLLLYLFAGATALLGNAVEGSVLVSVVLGTLTIPVVYLIGVELEGRTTGALAGGFLALLHAHVSLSRQAFLDAGFTFFFALTILLFLLWTRRRRTRWALATGAAAGATILSKLPGVLVLAPLLAGVLVVLWRDGPRARRRDLRHLGLAAVPPLLMGLAYLALLWDLEATRDLASKLLWQSGRVAGTGAASVGTTGSWTYYLTNPSAGLPALLGLPLMVLALLGAAVLAAWVVRRRDGLAGHVAVLVWPLAVLGFFSLSSRKVWFYLLPALPALLLLAALPLARLFRRFLAARSEAPTLRTTPTLALVALLVVAGASYGVAATEVQGLHVFTPKAYGYGLRQAAGYIDRQDPHAGQVGTLLGRFTLHFYNGHVTYHYYVDHGYVDQQIQAGKVRYVVLDAYYPVPQEQTWMRDLVHRYNGTIVRSYASPQNGTVMVRVYELHPGG